MFERRLYYHIDWPLIIAIIALCSLGVLMIYSTTFDPTRGTARMYTTQLYAIVIGMGALVFMLSIDYRTFTDKSHLIYIGVCALLLYVMFFGMLQIGARRRVRRGGVFGRHAHAHFRPQVSVPASRGAGRVEVRAQGLSEESSLDIPRSVAGCEGRRLPADPGAHHRGIGRAFRQGVPAGDAGSAAFSPGRPQRFHFLGAGRGTGFRRRPGGARPVFVRDSARAGGGPPGQGSPRLVPRARRARQLHLPG